jgi:glycosyltransferase involved in cell wall biosynthesis
MPVRVLHVTSSYPRWSGDVAGAFVASTASALVRAGAEVAVLAPHAPGAAVEEDLDGVAIRRYRYGPEPLERLAYGGGLPANARTPVGAAMVGPLLAAATVELRRLVRRWQPDVVHAHWWLPSGLVALGVGVPLVVTVHGSDARFARAPGVARLARLVLRRADAVATVSEALQRDIAALGIDADVVRMPAEAFGAVGPIPSGPPWRVLAIGRLTPEKGFDVLVEAAARAHVGVDLVGPGSPAALAALARRHGADVRFHGPLPHADIVPLLESAAAVVVPSRREGLGLVALEALAAGRPVIASDVGGLPEVVGEGDGVLLAPDDVTALAAALGGLPLPPPRAAAAARHAPAAVAAAHLALYDRVLSAR